VSQYCYNFENFTEENEEIHGTGIIYNTYLDIILANYSEYKDKKMANSTSIGVIDGIEKYQYICICNFREGSVKHDVIITQNLIKDFQDELKKGLIKEKPFVDPFINIDENFDNLVQKLTEISDSKNTKISVAPLVEAIKLNSSLFDKAGNKSSGWPEGEKRGNMDYFPPKGWIGHGLKVWDKYDNGDNTWIGMSNAIGEWCVAYHGVGRGKESNNVKKITGLIYKGNFKSGGGQNHTNCSDKFHSGKKVGVGVYCTPNIKTAEEYAGISNIKGKNYKTVLMVRVRPNSIRCCNDHDYAKDYWVVNGCNDEIRPYRILYKSV